MSPQKLMNFQKNSERGCQGRSHFDLKNFIADFVLIRPEILVMNLWQNSGVGGVLGFRGFLDALVSLAFKLSVTE